MGTNKQDETVMLGIEDRVDPIDEQQKKLLSDIARTISLSLRRLGGKLSDGVSSTSRSTIRARTTRSTTR